MIPSYNKIHNRFKLNDRHYGKEALTDVAYSFIKEGEEHEKTIGNFLLDWLDSNDCIQVKTSGSTGKPKKIPIKKEHMVNSAIATADFFGLKPGDPALLCLPATYIAGKMMLVRALILGLELDSIVPTLDLEFNVEKKYAFSAMIPAQVEHSLTRITNIKQVIIGGAPVSKKLEEQLQHSGTLFYATYGMTETVTHIAAKKLNKERGEVCNYQVLPNVSVATDQRDCLVIDAPYISDGKIITNDLVQIVSDKEFVWLGRYDNIINSGGIKLVPEEIERKLGNLIGHRFFVCGLPDKVLGEKLVLVIEDTEEDPGLIEKIKGLKTIEKFEAPRDIIFVSAFKETPNGKVHRDETLKSALCQ